MAYRQSLMKYAEKYGVSRANRKYNKSQSYIYFRRVCWDGNAATGKARNAFIRFTQPDCAVYAAACYNSKDFCDFDRQLVE